MAKQKIDMLAMADLFEKAAETGHFEFAEISYDLWLMFMNEHCRLKTEVLGKRAPGVIAEFKRLAGVARDLSKAQLLSKESDKLINKFAKAAQIHGWSKDCASSLEEASKNKEKYKRARSALEKHLRFLESCQTTGGN